VSKRAELPVFADTLFVSKAEAELSLILIRMIKLFYSCVAIGTVFALGTRLFLCDKGTQLRSIVA
jgi:hypothetical protein